VFLLIYPCEIVEQQINYFKFNHHIMHMYKCKFLLPSTHVLLILCAAVCVRNLSHVWLQLFHQIQFNTLKFLLFVLPPCFYVRNKETHMQNQLAPTFTHLSPPTKRCRLNLMLSIFNFPIRTFCLLADLEHFSCSMVLM